ncbi:hypothetical protein SNE40_012861 [Patella caerulea]
MKEKNEEFEFDYMPIPREDLGAPIETNYDRFIRKSKENPFVPMGMGVTTLALSYGLYQMKTGDRQMSQRMMRVRIVAQGATVVALMVGVLMGVGKPSK